MSKKIKASFKVANTGATNLFWDSGTANVTSAMGIAKVEPPPRPRWAAAFNVRSLYITVRSAQRNRDKALLEMLQLLHNDLKEPWGITLDCMYRV